MSTQKWEKYDKLIAADIIKVYGDTMPEIRLILAIALQAALDKDYEYLNLNNQIFVKRCNTAQLDPVAVLSFMGSI